MPVKIENARKIVVGTSWDNYKVYQKNSVYRQPIGECRLTDFLQNEDEDDMVDIYLKPTDGAKFLWKSMSKKTFLEVEYDSNFGT
jgi:hypothetical protein